jgi:hypothetical protein
MKILQITQSGINPANQTKAYETVSDNYQFIKTDDVESIFLDHGFQLDGRSYGNSKKRAGYQKHVSIFTRDDLMVGPDQLQLLLTNSHDGTSAFGLDIGVFRLVCANGCVSGNADTTLRIRHTKNALGRIDAAIQYLLGRMPQVAANIEQMQNIEIDFSSTTNLVRQAFNIRLGYVPVSIVIPTARRFEDQTKDLWTVFNVLQERVIRGGLAYINEDGQWRKTRKITAVNRTIKANKALWNAAMQMVAT